MTWASAHLLLHAVSAPETGGDWEPVAIMYAAGGYCVAVHDRWPGPDGVYREALLADPAVWAAHAQALAIWWNTYVQPLGLPAACLPREAAR